MHDANKLLQILNWIKCGCIEQIHVFKNCSWLLQHRLLSMHVLLSTKYRTSSAIFQSTSHTSCLLCKARGRHELWNALTVNLHHGAMRASQNCWRNCLTSQTPCLIQVKRSCAAGVNGNK